MKKLASLFNDLKTSIYSRYINDRTIFLTLFLIIYIIFFPFFLSRFDSWLTAPLLSTVHSNIWSDLLWVLLVVITIFSLSNQKSKPFFNSKNWFPLGIVFLLSYLYLRLGGDHYTYTSFSSFPPLKYADVFALILLIFVIVFRPRAIKTIKASEDEELVQVQRMIHSYLDMDTNYALLLNGKRGTGKTYFVKNRLLGQIGQTNRREEPAQYYIPIYISLYGLKSIEDIYSQLSMALKPHLHNDRLESDSYLAKIMVRGMLNIARAGNVDDYIKDMQSGRSKRIDVGNFVMIFDDLDRIDKGLTITELIGFVNSMVEHENNKVIIVADEDEVDPQETYKIAREKTFGTIVEFPDNFQVAFDEIIENRFSTKAPEFYQHLKTHKTIIFDQFVVGKCVSLRTLIYFLNHYHKIYDLMDNTEKKRNRDLEIQRRQRQFAIKFTSATAIEFKNGKISFHNKQGLDDLVGINTKLTQDFTRKMFAESAGRINGTPKKDPEIKTEIAYSEQFVTDYFLIWEYRYFRSIYEFVTGGNELDPALLSAEFKEIADAYFSPSPAEEIFNKLSLPYVFDLSNEEYRQLTEQMLIHADRGEYPLKNYLSIFVYVTRFPDIAKYDPDKLTQRLITAITENPTAFTHDYTLSYSHKLDQGSPYAKQYQRLSKTIMEANTNAEIISEEKSAENLFPLFQSQPEEFYERCKKDFNGRSIFNNWHFDTFYIHFLALKPTEKDTFTQFIESRYRYSDNESWIERDFIGSMIDKLSIANDGEASFESIVREELRSVLYKILERYMQADNKQGQNQNRQ